MAGAYVHALLHGRDRLAAAQYAHAAAALTVETNATVRPDLTDALVVNRLRAYQ
jgi:pseudouridine kinase